MLNKPTDYEKQFGKKVSYALAWPQRPPLPPLHLPETLSMHTPGPPHIPKPPHACTHPTCSRTWASRDPHLPAALPQAGICSHLPGRCRHSRAQKLLPGARLLRNLQLGGCSPHFKAQPARVSPTPRDCAAQGRCLDLELVDKLGPHLWQQEGEEEVAGQKREETGRKK